MDLPVTKVTVTQYPGTIVLGYRGENLAREITFDVCTLAGMDSITEDGIVMVHQRPGDSTPYPVGNITVDTSAGTVTWTVNSTDTLYEGKGSCEIQVTDGDGLCKPLRWTTQIKAGLMSAEDVEEAGANWIQALYDYVDDAITNIETTGDASGAATLSTARLIDGVAFDGSANIAHYGTCSTAAGTKAKTVSLSNYSLASGSQVVVKFTYKNSVASATLNVNSTGAKSIYLQGSAVTATNGWSAGDVVLFVYDGTQYNIVGMVSSTTAESGSDGSDGVGIASMEQTTSSTESGGVNVWTVTLSDGSTYDFTVYNGAKGDTGATGATGAQGEKGETGADGVGISKMETTTSSESGGANILTITLTNGTTYDFTVYNGTDGEVDESTITAIQEVAESAKETAESAKELAESAKELAESAKETAEGIEVYEHPTADVNETDWSETIYSAAAGSSGIASGKTIAPVTALEWDDCGHLAAVERTTVTIPGTDTAMSDSSTNPVANRTVKSYIDGLVLTLEEEIADALAAI